MVQCTDINETTQPEFQSDHTKILKSRKIVLVLIYGNICKISGE